MSDFIVEKLSKSVGDKTVFKDISFIIHDLDRIGLIGVNGTGKTTLLDVLSGVSGFDGDVSPFSAKNDYQIGYLTQDPDFDDSKTVLDTVLSSDLKEIQLIREYELIMLNYNEDKQARLERVMAEMDSLQAWEIESQVKTVLSKLGIQDLSTPVGELSGGLRRRVQLAQVLLGNHDLLLLDEPTNHLDIATIEWLTLFLKNSKKTVLFITHDRYFLDALSTRIFELDRAGLTEYQGNYQDYVRLKAEQDERDAALLHKKEQLYKQELAWMRRQPQARATKQQARINRFHHLKKEVSGGVAETDLTMNFETSRIGKKVIEFQDVSFAYENKPILQDFNLLVQAKDRIGIVGDNGVGKSTLLNLIAGSLEPTAGQVVIGETVRIAYFSQQIEGLDESKRVINYLQEVAEEVKTSGGSTTSIAELLEQFLFPRSTHGTLIEKLSGGEKKRLYLLKLLLEKPNVLLLDEPTNDLDIATLTVLENFLQGFAGPVLTVSHDRYFLDKVATKILAFEDGKIRPFFGHYTDYLDEKAFETELVNQVQKAEKEKVVKELPQAHITAIHKAIEKGVKLVLCTGRPLFGVLPYYQKLGLDLQNEYVIVNNGCSTHQTSDWGLVDWQELSPADIEYLYDLAKKSDVQLTLFDEEHYFVLGGKPNEIIQNDAKLVFSDLTEISLEEATSGKYRMFQGMFLGTESQTDDFEERFAEELCQRFSGVRSQPVIYEAMPLGTTKATALSRLADILKIDSSEIMAMGDANNDIEMLQFAGLGIAMGNASNYVKSLADDVTASNEEDGVARAIEKYIL